MKFRERRELAAKRGGCEAGQHVMLVCGLQHCDGDHEQQPHWHVHGNCGECGAKESRIVMPTLMRRLAPTEMYKVFEAKVN